MRILKCNRLAAFRPSAFTVSFGG